MRLNPVVIVATLLLGGAGLFFGVRAYSTYDDAAEAFTRVELAYVPNSFKWLDPEYGEGVATFRVINDSRFVAVVEGFSISVQFDGAFAGSDYNRWQELRVPGNATREIPAHFEITTNSIQAEGGVAELSFAGQMLVRFARFEQPLSFRFRGAIGQVDANGN